MKKRNGRPLRIIAIMDQGFAPPEHFERKEGEKPPPWLMEYDVISALRALGHQVEIVEVFDDLSVVRKAIDAVKPHIAFNLFEQFHGNALFDAHLVSYLELLRLSYTGCNPRGLMISRDKALSKKILAYHRIPVPNFVVFPLRGRTRRPKRLAFPLIVKSLIEEGSVGISQASVVHSDAELKERVEFIHSHVMTDAIAEEFIEGREMYIGVIGNARLRTLPPWELTFKHLPDGAAAIATDRAKWSPTYQKRVGVDTHFARELPHSVRKQLDSLSKRIYRTLYLSGYARLDFRLREDGKLFLLEANPNPNLCIDEDFARAAAHEGLRYRDLLKRILSIGRRYRSAGDE